MIKDRAVEEWQKRDVLEKLLDVWLKRPSLRLGQLIICAMSPNDDSNSIFNIEDYCLVEKVYNFDKKHYKKNEG
jgi:hypothetical protein